MTMISTLASVLISLGATAQPDPNSLARPPMPRQQQNSTPGPIADLPAETPEPTLLADFGKRRVNGIASNRWGRVFVSATPGAPGEWLLAERKEDGSLEPYPPVDPAKPLVLTSVTAIQIDPQERLWILDSANPDGKGVVRTPPVPGQLGAAAGPKLVCIELSTNQVVGVWPFSEQIVPVNSVLADVRTESNDKRTILRGSDGRESGVDPKVERHDTNWAYITDAGGGDAGGALLAVNLNAARVRRLLVGHVSTKAEPGFVATVGGVELKGDAAPKALNADAIVLDSTNEVIYFQPLGSRTLYSLKTAFIHDLGLPRDELAKKVNTLGPTVMATSLQIDAQGVMYFAAPERNAIVTRMPDGKLATFAQAPSLAWVEGLTFAREPGGKRGMAWMPTMRYGQASDDGYKVWQSVLNVPTTVK
jgi:hypothetical protein